MTAGALRWNLQLINPGRRQFSVAISIEFIAKALTDCFVAVEAEEKEEEDGHSVSGD